MEPWLKTIFKLQESAVTMLLCIYEPAVEQWHHSGVKLPQTTLQLGLLQLLMMQRTVGQLSVIAKPNFCGRMCGSLGWSRNGLLINDHWCHDSLNLVGQVVTLSVQQLCYGDDSLTFVYQAL